MASEFEVIWSKCLSIIRDNTSPQSYATWFDPIKPIGFHENVLTIQVPTQFFYEWLEEHYIDLLRMTIKRVIGREGRLEYSIIMDLDKPYTVTLPGNNKSDTLNPTMPVPISQNSTIAKEIPNPFIIPGIKKMQIDSQLNEHYTFDNFVEGECNRTARSAGLAISNTPGSTAFNPMMIFSSTGLGKTHLCHAIGLKVKHTYPNKNVLYVQAEQFVQQFVNACKNKNVNDFVHFYQLIDVLIIDDIQFLAGKIATQDTFFQIFNHLHQNNKQIVLTSDKAPVELQDIEPRLLSRFKWGLTCELQYPDFQTRVNILKQKLYNDGIIIPDDVIEYIANNVKTSIREMEGILISLVAQSSLNKKEVTIDLARHVIETFIRNTTHEVSIKYIIELVCDTMKVPNAKFYEKTRKHEIVQARQLAMYFSKKYTKVSLTNIGKECGNKDHATVLHACKTVENLIETDKSFAKIAADIEKKIPV